MTITLVEITRANWRAAMALEVLPEQQGWVADSVPIAAVALAKAYVWPEGFPVVPYAAYAGDAMVGMLNLSYEPGNPDNYWVFHFFIDRRWQGRGYGRAVLLALLALLRDAHPACRTLWLTVHPDNRVAQHLYSALGFARRGSSADGELRYALVLG